MNLRFTTLICCVFYLGAWWHLTNEEQIYLTSKRIIHSINDNDLAGFENLVNTRSKNHELMEFDLKELHALFMKHHINENSEIEITHLYDFLGKKLVRIPIDKLDTVPSMIRLDLYFGPPNINPLNQVCGYDVIWDNKDWVGYTQVDRRHRW